MTCNFPVSLKVSEQLSTTKDILHSFCEEWPVENVHQKPMKWGNDLCTPQYQKWLSKVREVFWKNYCSFLEKKVLSIEPIILKWNGQQIYLKVIAQIFSSKKS